MSAPTRIEQEHYGKLVGRTVLRVQWEDLEAQALPILLLSGEGRDGQPAHLVVLADPEGNGPGHLNPNLLDRPRVQPRHQTVPCSRAVGGGSGPRDLFQRFPFTHQLPAIGR